MSKSGKTNGKARRQFHHRGRRAAQARAEDTVARGTAALFTTAATRLLQREHEWTREAAVAFGDRLVAEATVLANEIIATGRQGDATANHGDEAVTGAADPTTAD